MTATTASRPTVPGYVNRIVKALLRSPLHRVMSRNTMLLTYTGRKSGRPYAVAVRYLRSDGVITCFTDSRWWINLRGGAPVELLIAGTSVSGIATPVEDRESVAARLTAFLHAVPGDSKYYGVRRGADGTPVEDDIRAAAEYTTVIDIAITR